MEAASPLARLSTLSTARCAMARRAAVVALPMCGVRVRPGQASRGSDLRSVTQRCSAVSNTHPGSGSGEATSSPAPRMVPARSAAASAAWSTSPPRDTFTRCAVGCMAASTWVQLVRAR